jgi:hypothetical protein
VHELVAWLVRGYFTRINIFSNEWKKGSRERNHENHVTIVITKLGKVASLQS